MSHGPSLSQEGGLVSCRGDLPRGGGCSASLGSSPHRALWPVLPTLSHCPQDSKPRKATAVALEHSSL